MIKALDIWRAASRKREKAGPHALGVRHVMIAVCDHFEPRRDARADDARARIEHWRDAFPKALGEFHDADGVAPKHTFFHPIEHYDAGQVEGIAELCRATGCETEVQLHPESGDAENLRRTLEQGTERLAGHGLLSRDDTGQLRYGFSHGHGGVRNEVAVLCQTGCYADFALPAASERTQSRTINVLSYARPGGQARSHSRGRRPRVARGPVSPREDELLMIPSPLALDWRSRKWGFLPGIESGDLTAANPPTRDRLELWLECRIAVENRPNWLFVKLHTHGAEPENSRMLLGEPMRAFHRMLGKMAAEDEAIRFHYVTARELVNIVHAAEAGHSGDPGQFRDFRYRRFDAAPTAATAAEPSP